MAQDNYIYDGEVYPDEFSATIANHPDIPEDIKRLYVSPAKKDEEPADYDYAGWQKETGLTSLPEGQHYPDTYKLPNHITFSTGSKYNGVDGNEGGTWTKVEGNPSVDWTFTPGKTNLENHSEQELRDYFDRVEPRSKLLLNDADRMALEASGKAADALKRAGSTLPTLDSDTGLRGSVVAPTPEYLRKLGIDTSITEEDYKQAQDLMMAFSGGGLTFAGTKSLGNLTGAAKNEAATNIGLANIMMAQGAKPAEILRKTGFFIGRDGKLRYEISDAEAKFNPDWIDRPVTPPHQPTDLFEQVPFNPHEGLVQAKLSEVLDHPELYKAYPFLKDITVLHDPTHPSAYANTSQGILGVGNRNQNTKETMLHEIQHFIQNHEGFAPGAAWGQAGKTYELKYAKEAKEQIIEPLQNMYRKIVDAQANGTKISLDDLKEYTRLSQMADKYNAYAKAGDALAYERYLNSAGEAEARNVETRAFLTKDEIRNYPPLASEDVAPELQRVAGVHYTSPYKDVGAPAFVAPQAPKVTPLRKAANDNVSPEEFVKIFKEDLPKYNTELDTSPLDRMLKDNFYQNVTKPHEEFIAAYDKLHEFGEWMSKKENYSEFNVARYNKMGKELSELNGDTWEPVKYIPKAEYVPSKDVAEYLAQADAQKAKMTESVKKSWLDMIKDYFKE